MRARALFALAIIAGALSGCGLGPAGLDSSLRPSARPADVSVPVAADVAYNPSPVSLRLRDQYRRMEADQRTRGLLRTDSGEIDAPFTSRQLAENFIQIALFDEYPGGRISRVPTPAAAQLRRWERPVEVALVHGASVAAAERARQQDQTRNYLRRLSAVAQHPVSLVPAGQENFTVFVVDEDERRALADTLRLRVPGASALAIQSIIDMPRSVSCLVVAFSRAGQFAYTDAVAIIRSEHPPALWRSCLHEEVAQGLGLSNDSPRARPSIFNDDEEFALLTGHDELLLSMLYDARLSPGMTPAQADPIVRQIAAEKLGESGPV
ncbi:MAG: DUF2927 domain-containing protein [Pseudomonadota bacterium]